MRDNEHIRRRPRPLTFIWLFVAPGHRSAHQLVQNGEALGAYPRDGRQYLRDGEADRATKPKGGVVDRGEGLNWTVYRRESAKDIGKFSSLWRTLSSASYI
jgi:hypothetical protein